ncbi:hypothetical protein GQ54DRAFT_298057 [Martensiomyces pterosporus]|nr:hypothetical protein GQ54DRAFT_298057 [Martensiomyces pterosporus]
MTGSKPSSSLLRTFCCGILVLGLYSTTKRDPANALFLLGSGAVVGWRSRSSALRELRIDRTCR